MIEINLEIDSLLSELKNLKNPRWISSRQKNNYSLFINLYQTIGYENRFAVPNEKWREMTLFSWKIQDELLPGNCTAAVINGSAISSCASLPLNKSVIYGHSYCMQKTLYGLLTKYWQMIATLDFVKLSSSVEYYAGSFHQSSGFTTKLFRSNDIINPIKDQTTIYSVQLLPNLDFNKYIITPKFTFEEFDLNTINILPNSIAKAILLFSQKNDLFGEYHKINSFAVYKNKNIKAVVISHQAPAFFTAADVFNFAWVFVVNEIDIAELVNFLRCQPELENKVIELIYFDGAHPPPIFASFDTQKHKFWVFTPRENIEQLHFSINEAVKSVLVKYSNDDIYDATAYLINSA